jgi:hypothetical protein
MHQKKIEPPLDITSPWRGLGVETPPSNVDLLVQKPTILLPTQKTFNTSPALAKPGGLASKLQTQNLSSQSDARYSIFILMNGKSLQKPSSGWTMWPCKQASDSKFELTI